MSSPLAMLSTAGIQDPNTRNFLDRLMQTWGNNFALREDVQREAAQAVLNAFGAGPQPPLPGTASQAIDALTEAIRNSLVQRILEQTITLPDLQALRNEVNAGMSSENTTRSSDDRALASALNRIWGYIGGSTALIEQGQLADVTPSSAVADKWDAVVAAVTDPNTGNVASAAILTETRAYANAADGTMNAIYSVKVQVGSGGSTLVGGFALAATSGAGSAQGPEIDFGIAANKFWIGAPASSYDPAVEYTSNNQFPFIVVTTPATINGVTYAPGVYMKSASIGEASIDTANIRNAAIKSAQIDNLAVQTAHIANLAVDSLQIAGNAVTIPVSTTASSSISLLSLAEQTLATLPTFTSKGGQVVINFGAAIGTVPDADIVANLQVKRNGVSIFLATVHVGTGILSLPPVTDVPGNGVSSTYTVTIQVTAISGATTGALADRAAYALETIK